MPSLVYVAKTKKPACIFSRLVSFSVVFRLVLQFLVPKRLSTGGLRTIVLYFWMGSDFKIMRTSTRGEQVLKIVNYSPLGRDVVAFSGRETAENSWP